MAFVYEPFTDEEKKRVNFAEIRKLNPSILQLQHHWVVDRERNAFLVWGGVDRDPPYSRNYWISINGKLFSVYLTEDGYKMPDGYFTATYKFIGWGVCVQETQPIQQDYDDAKPLLREALQAFRKESPYAKAKEINFDF